MHVPRTAAFVSAGLALFALTACTSSTSDKALSPDPIEVAETSAAVELPEVADLPADEARDLLREAGFTVTLTSNEGSVFDASNWTAVDAAIDEDSILDDAVVLNVRRSDEWLAAEEEKEAESPERVRTDLSSTLFLSDPDSYDGGELVIQDTYGVQQVKLAAGDLVLYPGTSLHKVNPVTRGQRYAAFFWTQSLVREDSQRALLFEMDNAIQQLTADVPDHPSLLQLTGTYHNLLRRWAEV